MAYLLDPGEGKYALEDLALRYLSLELTSPDQVEGTLDFDGEAGAHEAGRRVAVLMRLGESMSEALAARELVDLYERIERPLVPVLARDGGRRRPHRRRLPRTTSARSSATSAGASKPRSTRSRASSST